MNDTLKRILSDYVASFADVQEQNKKIEKIKNSKEYKELETMITDLQTSQKIMLDVVDDHTEEHDMDKDELFKYLEANAITEVEGFSVGIRKKKEVDVLGVLHAMEGDMDNLMLVTSIKQKDLENFWKDNPDYKKPLKACVNEVGFKVTSVTPEE